MSYGGLIPSQQTRPNTTDEYYLRKGQPIVSPLVIASLDGTHTSTLSTSNGGDLTVSTAGPGVYNDIILMPEGNLYLQPQAEFTQVGEGTEVSGAVLNIAGASGPGRVYDTVYNKVAAQQTVVASTSGPILVGGSLGAYTLVNLPSAGYYIFELSVENAVKTPAVISFLEMYCTDNNGGQVINQTSVQIASTSFATTQVGPDPPAYSSGFVLTSGIFPANGAQTLRLHIDTVLDTGVRVGTAWTGTWELKITQIATAL